MSVDAVEAMLVKVRVSLRYMHPLRHYKACTFICIPHPAPPRARAIAQDSKPTYFFGDVKGKMKRFCGDELKQHCGINPGDWSIMWLWTVLESGHSKVYGIGHRRGGE
eukprot:778468-Pleurochrysis_carterae.AAC.1